jgi:hypothetical protein
MKDPQLLFRVHAVQRMFERKVSVKNVIQALQSGEIIEDYSSEMPEPSRLLLGFRRNRPFHVVISENVKSNITTVITVYNPNPDKWKKGFRRRQL